MRPGLTSFVVLAMVLGALGGAASHNFGSREMLVLIDSGLDVGASIFMRAIKALIAPLVLFTLIGGIAQMGQAHAIERVVGRAFLFFVSSSVASMVIGLAIVEAIQPGGGMVLSPSVGAALPASPITAQGFVDHVVPTSIIDAMARNEVLQIVAFASLIGITLAAMGEAGQPLVRLTHTLADAMLKMTGYVMLLAPLAVFCAVAKVVADRGLGVVVAYSAYVGGFYLALALVVAALALAGIATIGGRRFRLLVGAIRQPTLIALSTASSEAAYPLLLERLEQIGISKNIASFVLPLGYAFNLVGSMCYCIFAVMFVAQAYGVHFSGGQILQLFFLLFVMSKGIASVPRASLLVVASVLPYFDIPAAGVALILGVDHFMDMGRTAINTVGNSIIVAAVAGWEQPAEVGAAA